jgi:hypothetical protein
MGGRVHPPPRRGEQPHDRPRPRQRRRIDLPLPQRLRRLRLGHHTRGTSEEEMGLRQDPRDRPRQVAETATRRRSRPRRHHNAHGRRVPRLLAPRDRDTQPRPEDRRQLPPVRPPLHPPSARDQAPCPVLQPRRPGMGQQAGPDLPVLHPRPRRGTAPAASTLLRHRQLLPTPTVDPDPEGRPRLLPPRTELRHRRRTDHPKRRQAREAPRRSEEEAATLDKRGGTTLPRLRPRRQRPYYAAYVLVLIEGLRKGESLGLTDDAAHFDAMTLRIENQLQRVARQLSTAKPRPPAPTLTSRSRPSSGPHFDFARPTRTRQTGRGRYLARLPVAVHHEERDTDRTAQLRPGLAPTHHQSRSTPYHRPRRPTHLRIDPRRPRRPPPASRWRSCDAPSSPSPWRSTPRSRTQPRVQV